MSGRAGAGDPFAALGIDPQAEVGDDDVRSAWRRVAAATHPDRDDGGDPERFATAAAAYTELRTAFGRGEARAGLRASGAAGRLRAPGWPARVPRPGPGRAVRLVPHVVLASAAGCAGALAAWPGPAAPALVAGAATWLALATWRSW